MDVKSSGNKHEMILGQEDSFVIGSENYVTIGSKMEAMLGTQSEFTMAMKSVFDLAGTIECKAGHNVEFGKTTERIKDEDELLGTDKVTIGAGLPAAEKAVLSGTAKALTFGGAAIGALLAAAGGDIAGAFYPDEEKGVDAMKQMGASMAPITAGTVAQVLALTYLVKKLNTALTNAIAKIDLNDEGITISATNLDAQGATNDGIKMSVGAPKPAGIGAKPPPDLTFNMTPGAGAAESITLEKNQGGKITVNSEGVKLEQHGNQGSITVSNADIKLKKGNADDKYCKITDQSLQLKHGNGTLNLRSDSNVASLVYGNNAFIANQNALLLKVGNAILRVQPNGVGIQGSLLQLM